MAKNGSSVIDLIICCGSICDIPHRSSVDKDVELFSGAPNRGHIPVTVEFESVSEAITTKTKPWIEKADWDNWSLFLEQNSYSVPSNQADELWIFTKSLIAHASQYFIPSKTVSKHSKPFWNTKLEEASKSLREARRKFKRSSNYSNGEDLREKRELFKGLLSESASMWIRNQLEQLGHKRGREFWKCHKRLFKDKFENIVIVRNKNGELLCDPMSISQEFRKTFFEGRHLEGNDFHDWQPTVDYTIPELCHELDRDFSMVELNETLKNCRSSLFDNDMIHVTMLKKLEPNMKNLLLFLFNTCWITSTWPWNISRITLIKKPGTKSYEQCSSYRPLSNSSHVGKLFERMISARLKLYFETHNILDEQQEGFRTHRSTNRSLYRMHLVLGEAKRSKRPTALLNIDLEKAFDSIWVQGLLYKLESVNLPHRLLCIISSFLSNRKAFIDINGHYTELFDINVGLPQGSVLSPLLFIF